MNKPTEKDRDAMERIRKYALTETGFGGTFFDGEKVAQIIAERAAEAVKEAMQKLLDEGHGGGNWRRVAMQIMDEVKKEDELRWQK